MTPTWRTIAPSNDPEVVKVEKSARVRLRIINGSSGTNYFVDLGNLQGELIATDGMPIEPIRGNRFPHGHCAANRCARANSLPTAVRSPSSLCANSRAEQTGVILATAGATIARIPVKASSSTGLLTLDQEKTLRRGTSSVAAAVDQSYVLRLGGNMSNYTWTINGVSSMSTIRRPTKPGVLVKYGERVVIKFVNETPMSHPMHLHGHSFQVIDINGQSINGAVRDTILVTGNSSVSVAFDANNPGLWYLHCHVLWHLAAGMATLVQYQA